MADLQATKLRSRKPNWSELPIDPSEIVLSKLTPKSILRFKAVCTSWNEAAESILRSSSFTCIQEPPWLLLPQDGHNNEFRFSNLEGKTYNLMSKNMPEELRHSVCLGSDQSLLLLLVLQNMKHLKLLLLDPFKGTQLLLPPLSVFPDILHIAYFHDAVNMHNDDDSSKIKISVNIKITNPDPNTPPRSFNLDIRSMKDFQRKFLTKVVTLSSRPSSSSNNTRSSIEIFVMFRYYCGEYCLAFCTPADDEWTKFDEQVSAHKQDITSYYNQLYALCYPNVQVWDFVSSLPVKKLEIKLDASSVVASTPRNVRFCDRFIIKTDVDDLFLVFRLCFDNIMEPTVFHVYKRDSNNRWMAVDSISDHALVLSAKQSIVISSKDCPEYDQNSVYSFCLMDKKQCRLVLFSWRNKVKEVCIGEVELGMPYILFVPNPFSHIRDS